MRALILLAACAPHHDIAPDVAPDNAPDVAIDEPATLEDGELLPGGATTTTSVGIDAFSQRAANAGIDRNAIFQAGLQFFHLPWEVAPGRPETDGLGPTYDADGCPACHVRNGRGSIETVLLRFGTGDLGTPLANYGSQLQHLAIAGVAPEGTPMRTVTPIAHVLADGTTVMLDAVSYSVANPAYGPLGDDLRISPRIAPAIIGQGLIEATSGHFGWKALQPTVTSQTAAAFSQDIGITSSGLPSPNCPPAQVACAQAPNGGAPELIDSRLQATVGYVQLLGVPARRDGDSPDVLRGKALFKKLGCTDCHRPSVVTSESAAFPELAAQKIWPYSDFQLHDLGEGLADHYAEGAATGTQWRTPPLWGLGLQPIVGDGEQHLLHDGRAHGVDEAIYWHDGEARESRLMFERLTVEQRALVRRFVESL